VGQDSQIHSNSRRPSALRAVGLDKVITIEKELKDKIYIGKYNSTLRTIYAKFSP
jgi:hypothetical protein